MSSKPPLTYSMREALTKLRIGPGTAYGLGVTLVTIHGLQRRGLVTPIGRGHIAMPRNATWMLTKAGQETGKLGW